MTYTPELLYERSDEIFDILMGPSPTLDKLNSLLFEGGCADWTLDQRREAIHLARAVAVAEADEIAEQSKVQQIEEDDLVWAEKCLALCDFLDSYDTELVLNAYGRSDDLVVFTPNDGSAH